MPSSLTTPLDELTHQGFILLRNVFPSADIAAILANIASAFAADDAQGTLRSRTGGLYGARNVATLWPEVVEVWRKPALESILAAALGAQFGLVRVLFFDKPPEQSWSLPWHRDLTIAVADNALPSNHFRRPTTKASVPHVEAPTWLLERMLTARIHLDEITADNGPLQVLTGSHRLGTANDVAPASIPIHSAAGDVFLMRPLLSHCSGHSAPGTQLHRRILHLEFAADSQLPDDYQWQMFLPHDRIPSPLPVSAERKYN